jgi:hypothetical protein
MFSTKKKEAGLAKPQKQGFWMWQKASIIRPIKLQKV